MRLYRPRALAGAVVGLLAGATLATATTYGPLPNLVVTQLSEPPATVVRGASFAVGDRVLDRGGGGAAASRAGLYLQRTLSGTRVRRQVGERRLPPLGAGRASSGRISVRVPPKLATGRWRLVACADPAKAVRESNEGDNCRSSTRTTVVVAPKPKPPPPGPGPAPAPRMDVTLAAPPAGALLNTRTPAFDGTADPRAPVTVRVYSGDSAAGAQAQAIQAQPTSSGSWTAVPTSPLADGTYTAQAQQTEAAVTKTSPTRTFRVDATAPAVSIARPAAGSTTNLMTLDGAAGTAAEDSSTVTVRLYAGTDTSAVPLQTFDEPGPGTDWSATAAPVPPGTYTVTAEQGDTAGNVGRATTTFAVPVSLLAAGDIASCAASGDEATAALVNQRSGTVAPLGDNAYESPGRTPYPDCYAPSWGPFLPRTMPTPGNHEYSESVGAADYFGYFGAAAGEPGKGYYSYDLGGWHVIVLNTSSDCVAVSCAAGSPQEQWLRDDLARSPAKCTLAYFHHPLFSSYLGQDAAVRPLWSALQDGGADVVLNGHAHNYERYAPQGPLGTPDPIAGVREFVVGTGGDSHHAFGASSDLNSQVRDDTSFGILDLTLAPDGYSWRFVPADGAAFTDSGSATCH